MRDVSASKAREMNSKRISVILLILSAALYGAARLIPGFAPWYSRTFYPVWQGSLGRLCGLAPFSVSEILIWALPVFLIVLVVRRRKEPVRIIAPCILLISVLLFLYVANCGVNYARDLFWPLPEDAAYSEDLLAEFCEEAVSQIRQSSDSWDSDYPREKALARESVRAMKRLGEEYPDLAGFYPQPKPILGARFFSMMGVTGIYSPFTIEANYNREITAYNLPFTACHELSHLKGFMNESEANFIGFLACIGSEDPGFQRSGWMLAWVYAGNSLYRVNPERMLALRQTLPEDALAEIHENNVFWDTYENKASEVQDAVNDTYLKANGQEEGIRSYGLVTDLMLDWYRKQSGS